ncbi:MAG: ABC transporter ATP-binding protein [Ostreibacterium sp.]
MSTLEIKHIVKTYPNGKEAIRDANVKIESGEFIVFVGPSGCGKSTLLRMIAGLESTTDGDILLEGKRINEVVPADRDIAMVFQNYALYPHMSVYKNLAYGLINRKFPKDKIKQRVHETAKMLQLSEYLDRKPSEMSGGQRQRIAMGRAIVREPKLFLFDEPLSNLDAKLRDTMRLEIKSLQKRLKTTTIYVTHDQIEAMTMADKIVILSAGKIEQVGTPQEIYNQPANLFVASFIGSPTMNILEGSLSGKNLTLSGENTIHTHFNLDDTYQNTLLKVGIRPECVSLSKNALATSIKVTVEVVEDLGAHRVIHAHLGEQSLLVTTNLQDIKVGESIYAELALSSLYLFDPKTGQNLANHFRN